MTAGTGEFAQRRRWRAFSDRSIEASYREWHLSQILPMTRILTVGSIALWGVVPLVIHVAVGEVPRAVYIGDWAIAIPALLAVLLASYTRLRRFAVETLALLIVGLGLNIIWFMGSIYNPASGPVVCAVLALVFYPLVLRLPTGATAAVAATLTTIPVFLQISGMRDGDISINSWPYISALVASAPMIVLAAALIETGMRQQFAAQTQLQASQRLLRRYVPEQVADAVTSGTHESIDRHERRKLTIFFSDLVGFTDLSEELEPEDLATVLHDYFTEMSAIARKHGGTVDDLVGDAILVLFGAPERTDDHDQALRAVRMAVEMQEAMGPLNQRWASAGIPEALTVRMGVNTGVATVGNFGSAERTKYTALGRQVNVAARIQAQCQPGKVLISHSAWLLVRDEITCTPKGELTLKGLHKPMAAYEVQA